jgi:hypothetical protein
MTRKKIITISLIFIILSVIFLFLIYFLDKNNSEYGLLNNESNSQEGKEELAPSYDIVISDAEKISSLARGFVQTIKTYSNKTNFSNIVDMYPLMTDSLKSEMVLTLETYLENIDLSSDFNQKVHVRSVDLILFNEGDTVSNVEVFCDKYSGNDSSNLDLEEVKYILDLIKIGSEWKVNKIY